MNLGQLSMVLGPMLEKLFAPLWHLILALLLLMIGWLVARGLQMGVSNLFRLVQADAFLQRIGFTQVLAKGDIKRPPSDLVGDLVYWILLFVTILSVAAVAGLTVPTNWVESTIGLLINIFNAVLILGLAIYLAAFVGGVVYLIASNAGIAYAKTLSKVAHYSVIITALVTAFGLLGIRAEWIAASINVVVGGMALAFAIAFGLGCKDIAGDFVTNLFRQK